jgi:hypothetical protein
MTRPGWKYLAAPLVALALLSGCTKGTHVMTNPPEVKVPMPSSTSPVPPGTSGQQLASLDVVDKIPDSDKSYRRDAFGQAWADVDKNGCTTRVDVLAARVDRSQPYTDIPKANCAHDIVAGTWVNPYTGVGKRFNNVKDPKQAQQIPIDHVVALSLAWRSGAKKWTPEQRLLFANDLRNLTPTSRSINSDKSDKGPEDWSPPVDSQDCLYAKQFVKVKAIYGLATDRDEKQALANMLDTCPR